MSNQSDGWWVVRCLVLFGPSFITPLTPAVNAFVRILFVWTPRYYLILYFPG